MTVVSLKQRYDGHAKRAGLVAAGNAYMGRIVVVVDEDIDPSNINDVMWAIATRCEPAETVDIIRNGWSSTLDPRIPPADKEKGITSHSKMIINACRPFSWIDQFPRTTALSQDEAREIEDKWLAVITGRAPRLEPVHISQCRNSANPSSAPPHTRQSFQTMPASFASFFSSSISFWICVRSSVPGIPTVSAPT